MYNETPSVNKGGGGDKINYLNFFAFLARTLVLDIHTQCFMLLVECQLKIQLKILTVSIYSCGFHRYPFHLYTSVHYSL
jgi:hypothetical protein